MYRALFRALAVVSLAMTAACGRTPDDSRTKQLPPFAEKDSYAVFPDRDEGADPTVPAAMGGKGFSGDGWETNTGFDLPGDPHATKVGIFREAQEAYPATLRPIGPNVSPWWSELLYGFVYESLLAQHPFTLEYIPMLATHWQVSPDKTTFRFRLDPNARFSDGSSVTADDVVATWRLNADTTLQDPVRSSDFNKFEAPVAESPYIVRVRSKEPGQASFDDFARLPIYPAEPLRDLGGGRYLRDFNDRMLPGSGSYSVAPRDRERKVLRLLRRQDYWAFDSRRNVGVYNFNEVREVVVAGDHRAVELLERGELDFAPAGELHSDLLRDGVLQRRGRFVYWNKFGQPQRVNPRLGDRREALTMWWIDRTKEIALGER